MNINNITLNHLLIIRKIAITITISILLLVVIINAYSQETLYEDQSQFSNETYDYTTDYEARDKQQQEQEQELKTPLEECKLLHDGSNIKIIDMMYLENTLNNVCMIEIDELLNNSYTIKGTLKDRYIILENTT